MARNPEEIQKILKDIQKIYNRLGETNPFKNFDASAFDKVEDAVNVVNQGLDTAERKLQDIVGDAGELVSSFRAIVSEVSAGNKELNSSTKSFNNLTSIASKLQSDQAGINTLRKKELQSLQDQFKQEKLNLENNRQSLGNRAQELAQKKRSVGLTVGEERELRRVQAAHKATVGLIHDQDSAMAELNRKIGERLDREGKIEEAMGLGGAAVDATSSALGKLGFGGLSDKLGLDDVKDKMRDLSEEAAAGGENTSKFSTKMNVLKGGIKQAGKNLVSNLKDPLAVTAFLAKEFIDALIKGDKATGELAKGFNMSYKAASQLRSELAETANYSADVNVSIAGLQESMMAVGKTLGSNVKLNEQDLVTFTKLREQAGMTNEELASMQRLTLATGGTLEDNTGEFLAQAQITAQNNGVVLNTKQLMSETANVSDAIKLSLGGSAGELAKAAAQAKALGMSLDQVDKISESLLNFESSISSELEAELLTGKNLTLEKARQAALNGDLATVAEEISNQLGSAAEFTKMNRIQQEALAKSVGMTREDLAKTLMEKEALAGLSGEEAKAGKATFDALVKQYGVEEAQRKIKEEGLENLMSQQSISERFNKSIEKLRDTFMSLAQPVLDILSPLLDIVNVILPAINFLLQPLIGAIKAVAGFIRDGIEGPMAAIKEMLGGIVDIFKGDFEKGFAKLGKGVVKLILSPFQAVANLVVGLINGVISGINLIPGVDIPELESPNLAGLIGIDDGMIGPDGGLVVSGKKGTYKLNSNDTVVAGTDLGSPAEEMGPGAATPAATPSIDMSPVIAELQAVKTIMTQILNKEGSVYIDSTKAGTAFAVGTSKLGS